MRIGVVGAGVVGLATTRELLKRGHDAWCFESDQPMAARSTGDTRIFRYAHTTAPLVEWARRAHSGWKQWNETAGRQFVGTQGTVVSGDISAMAAALREAGASCDVTSVAPSHLPVAHAQGPHLWDPHGGAIRAAETGAWLISEVGEHLIHRAVSHISIDGKRPALISSAADFVCDAVVIAAGAGTAGLAADVGIEVPTELTHHARFTFATRDALAVHACWMERSEAWRPGFTSYGHSTAPGRWAVGAHLPAEDTAWQLGRTEATRRAREAVTAYVREYVGDVEPQVLETVYCDVTPGLGDGISVERSGPVCAVWGDNLFKMAPALGESLAQAAVDQSIPAEFIAVRHQG
jgi:glycine/D-amino acid oxidase-like deaminating enzyme